MLPSIARLASLHGIVPLKKYSQNFIFDENLCDKIVKYANVDQNSCVIEIGPGPGGLTRSILKSNPGKLKVIENDSRCIALLEEIKSYYSILEILHTDARLVKISNLIESAEQKVKIIANLPYSIGTNLLLNWLEESRQIDSMVLMFQKEVADRIIASPGSKAYGRLSIICQLLCKVEKCFDLDAKAFYPPPKVSSTVVKLIPFNSGLDAQFLLLLKKITASAFAGRRKMIKTSLGSAIPDVKNILEQLNISPKSRAEDLSPNDYLKIIQNITKNN